LTPILRELLSIVYALAKDTKNTAVMNRVCQLADELQAYELEQREAKT